VKAVTIRRWITTGALETETIREGRRSRHRIKKIVIETIETSRQPNITTIASRYP
jgi:hypothetical protein